MTTTMSAVQVAIDANEFTLNAAQRCDRCGAQAYMATAHINGVLLWCAHHADEHEPRLKADDRVTVLADHRWKLREQESGRSSGEEHS